ncbi:MAG: hypothetical protein M3N16_00910 [Actinomycetota bacterium]|nr:hypothetical protein [Actinomycetota bacterium]
MSIAYLAHASVSDEEYRRVEEDAMREPPPEGHVLHLSGKADDGTRWFVDVWENVEAAQRFERDRLFPAFERHGISPGAAPTVIEVDVLGGAAVAAV